MYRINDPNGDRLKNSFNIPARAVGFSDTQTVLGCPTLALPAQIHGAAGTEPRENVSVSTLEMSAWP